MASDNLLELESQIKDIFTKKEFKKEYELYQSYERFNVYDVYKVYSNNKRKFLYRTTIPNKNFARKMINKSELLNEFYIRSLVYESRKWVF